MRSLKSSAENPRLTDVASSARCLERKNWNSNARSISENWLSAPRNAPPSRFNCNQGSETFVKDLIKVFLPFCSSRYHSARDTSRLEHARTRTQHKQLFTINSHEKRSNIWKNLQQLRAGKVRTTTRRSQRSWSPLRNTGPFVR